MNIYIAFKFTPAEKIMWLRKIVTVLVTVTIYNIVIFLSGDAGKSAIIAGIISAGVASFGSDGFVAAIATGVGAIFGIIVFFVTKIVGVDVGNALGIGFAAAISGISVMIYYIKYEDQIPKSSNIISSIAQFLLISSMFYTSQHLKIHLAFSWVS